MFRKLYDWTLGWARSRHAPVALGAVSFVESSVFPIPADVLFVPMCAARPEKAMGYAFLATVTSVLGGIFGWAIGFYAFELIAQPILEFYGKLDAFDALSSRTGQSAILVMLVTSGLFARTERVLVLGAGLLTGWLRLALWLLAVVSLLTAGHRLLLAARGLRERERTGEERR